MSEEDAQFLEILPQNKAETLLLEGCRKTVNRDKSVYLLLLRPLRFTVHEMMDKINSVRYYREIDLCKLLLN